MNEDHARARLAAARVGRLATITPTGTPHLVPVVFAVVGEFLYTALDSKPKTTMSLQRLANIDANGLASLLVDAYTEDWSTLWWVRVDGSAQVLTAHDSEHGRTAGRQDRPEQVGIALKALARKYPQYLSQPPTGPVIAVRVTRWVWWEATPSR
jgi:PPOX class probable F420-dependent enzyme